MLQNLWNSKKDKGKARNSPFLAYSVFGDPATRFEAFPDREFPIWVCPFGEYADLRMLMGLAWLNRQPITILTADAQQRDQVSRWAEEARGEALQRMGSPLSAGTELSQPGDFAGTLAAWRVEWKAFQEALSAMGDRRFGVINAFEAASTLIRLHTEVDRIPLSLVDRNLMRWTPEEFQEILERCQKGSLPPEHLTLLLMAQRMDIHLPVLLPWPEKALERALTDRMDRLSRLIVEFEHILFRLRVYFKAKSSAEMAPEQRLRRSNVLALEEGVRHQCGLSAWISALQLFEQELISDAWFVEFTGFHGISLEEIDRELRSMHTRLRLLRDGAGQWTEAARIQDRMTSIPEYQREVLLRMADFPDSSLETSLTYWYLYGWLEQAVSPDIWMALENTPLRKSLSRQLVHEVDRALTAMRVPPVKETSPPFRFHCLLSTEFPAQDTGICLYWNAEPPDLSGEAFRFPVRSHPAVPLDYRQFQQLWEGQDADRRFALPYPIPFMQGFWDGAAERWSPFALTDAPVSHQRF